MEKNTTRRVMLLALLAVCSALPSLAGRVSGVVRDASGTAIAGVTVRLQPVDTKKTTLETKTKKKGSYIFGLVDKGEYKVSVDSEGSRIAALTMRVVDQEGKQVSEFSGQIAPGTELPKVKVDALDVATIDFDLAPASSGAGPTGTGVPLAGTVEIVRWIESGKTVEARAEIERGLEARPDDPRFLYLDAYLEMKENKLEQALASIDEAIASPEAFPGVGVLRGVVLEKLERDEEALAAFELETQSSEPKVVRDAWVHVVQVARRLGRQDKVDQALNALIAADPNDAVAYSQLLEAAIHGGNPEAVKALLEKAPPELQQDPRVHFNLGVQYLKTRDLESAVLAFAKATELDPSMADAYVQLGFAEVGLGHTDRAKQALLRYLELEPEGAQAPTVRDYLEQLDAGSGGK